MAGKKIENIRVGDTSEGTLADSILVDGELIAAVGRGLGDAAAETIDGGGATVLPGFIDVHIHGAVGVDVNAADAEGLMRVAAFLARHGVTAWVPTLVPDSDENYPRAINEISRLMKLQEGKPVAQALGVHYEGIFANEKMCGALRPQFFKKFTGTELNELPKLANGVKMMTFAPEVEGGIELAEELSKNGWIGSIGHSRAGVGTLDAAFAAGTRHMTHFFNAMTGVHHRDIGVAGWGLTNQDVSFDIIADGIHVEPRMLDVTVRAKGFDKVSLISDSVAPAGLGDGEFEIWGEKVRVENGRTQNARGSIAGSVITMHDALLRMRSLGWSNGEAAKMAAANPARLIGVDGIRGSIESGKRADLIGIDQGGTIRFVMIGGKIVKSEQ